MSIRKIVLYPAPILRQIAAPVETIDDAVRQLVADLVDTMRAHRGLGLAAPQVGSSLRICVVELPPRAPHSETPLVLINPQLSDLRGKSEKPEACLSLPGRQTRIRRATSCVVTAIDSRGEPLRYLLQNMEARVVQHEVDHLDGILIIDTGSKIRSRLREALT